MQFACSLKDLLFGELKSKTWIINVIIAIFCRRHPVVFVKLKGRKIVSGFSQTQHIFTFILA
jgi:hypothetical protein